MKASTGGDYTLPYFGAPEEGDEKGLGAVVQNSLLELVFEMRSEGRAREIAETSLSEIGPRQVSRDEFLVEVKVLTSKNGGRELPWTQSPAIIAQLFRNQSKLWRDMLGQLAENILEDAHVPMEAILKNILEAGRRGGRVLLDLNASLKSIGQSMKQKLEEIMAPHETLHPTDMQPKQASCRRYSRKPNMTLTSIPVRMQWIGWSILRRKTRAPYTLHVVGLPGLAQPLL